jgi:hypothetical protein
LGERKLTEYNFETQLKIEDEYTPLILKYLEQSSGLKPVDVRNQCLEYDFLLGAQRLDLKADTLMCETNNFFIETESVRIVKKGWLYNQNVDVILYLDTKRLHLYLLPLKHLQEHEKQIISRPFKTIRQDKNYQTAGHIIPIDELFRLCQFKRVNLAPLSALKLADVLEARL